MSINNVAAFQGWNSSLQGWNTGTWNTNVAYTVTATGQIGSAASVVNIGVAPTGVSGTSALGDIFTTNVGLSSTASVNSATVDSRGEANIFVAGVSATGLVTAITDFPVVWGQIIPSQTSNFSAISPSQDPSWTDVAA